MNRNNNIFLKLSFILILFVGWGGRAWADRIEPNIVSALTSANENVRNTWCYIHFVNSNGGYVYCAADGNNLAFSSSKRINNDNLWALIGTQSSFVLRNRNGLYAKWDGEKYVGTADASAATPCTYTQNTNNGNTTYWNLHRVAASATTNWNPQGQIKEWGGDADGGSRMEFSVVMEDDWNSITNPNYHVLQYSPAPTASGWAVGTHWYKMTNARSLKNLAACAGYMDGDGYLKTRGSGEVAENSDQWCFVQDTNGKVTIYNKAAGPNQVLGSITNRGSNDVRTKLLDKNEDVANFSKLYTVGANSNGYYVLIDGLTNGYWDDNASSGYLATWQVSQAGSSEGGRFIVSEVLPEGYRLTITGDNNYAVTYDNVVYHDGDILPMSIDDLDLKNLTGFSINCSDKFVYGPVINKGLQTITYTVKDMVTSVSDFTTGFYQLQLFDDNSQKVNNVNNRINGSAGNINTKSNAIYVMPYKDVPTGGDQNLAKYSGAPAYANEASTFFYIEKNGNNLQVQSVNGHYAVNDGNREKPVATRAASAVTSGYAFPDGHLQLTGWVIQGTWNNNGCNGIEGPRMAYSGGTNYEKYNAAKVDMNQYSIYKVAIENATNASDIANDPNVVIVGGSAADGNNRGLSKVYRNGYLFFDRGYVPTAADFNLNGTTYNTNFRITIGTEVNGITPITFSEIPTAVPFRVIITGDKKDDEVITYHNNHRFKTAQTSMLVDDAPTSVRDGESFQFRLGITAADLRDCDFSSSAASRTNGTSFVYGPVIDWENRTITCEIREAITALPETGWYQLKWDVSTDNNVAVDNRYTNAREDTYTNPVRDNNRFYLTMPKGGNPGRNEYTNYNVHPTTETAPLTFVKLVRSGNNLMVMTIDGRYLNQDGTPSTSGSGYANPVSYVANGELDFRHWFPFPSFSYMVGKATDTHNYFYTTPAKFDHSNLEFYEVYIHYEGVENQLINGRSITYNGTATNYSMPTVYSGGYLVFPSGTNITRSEFTINNTADDDIKNVTIDRTNHRINIELKLPKILHRSSHFYTKLSTESNKPVYGHIGTLEAEDNGMTRRADGIDEQKTSVFEIPVYLKPGDYPRNLYLPSDMLKWYQRWYNYETDGLVNRDVMPALYSENYVMYQNGHISGSVNGNSGKGYVTNPRLYLPTTLPTEVIDGKTYYKDYLLTMDISRYKDNSMSGNNFVEPTLSQRVIYRIMDANKIATEIKAKTEAGDWYEKLEIIFPCKKRGEQSNNNTGADLVPLNMDLYNYWGYNGTELVQLTTDGQITVELAPESTAQLAQYGLINGRGGISRVDFNRGHFITFTYPTGNVAPDNSKAILNVYFTAGGTRYNLAQFTLNFQPNVEPKVITDVIGKDGDGYISSRSPHAMTAEYGNPIAQLQFDNVRVDAVAPAGGVDSYNTWNGWNSRGEYAYPLDFSMSSYGYGYGSDSGTSRGEYGIFKFSQCTGNNKYTYYPVKRYFDTILQPAAEDTEFVEDNDYIIYVDAADQAGQVMSIPIAGGLCPGTRLYCYGWMASNAGGSNPASVILSIVGHKSDGTTKILTSYCPGILSAWAYRDLDDARIYSFNPTSKDVTTSHGANSNWGLWQQIGFSFMLDKQALDTYSSFSMQVYNNCYNSSGGDYLLDNFQIFANPPKGEVDFTTPLCSDKIRHAKVHADFDMLKNLSGVNETNPEATISTTYCFLDAQIFDNFEEGGLKIADLFEVDEQGNHNLKPTYSETDPKVVNIINHAFRMALVGSRYNKESGKEDHGFHTYSIPTDYSQIPVYAYNDSRSEIVYREVDDNGVRRLVFKENIMRGEMEMEPAEPGNEEKHPAYWPYMRPSRTYYLVFSPILASQTTIDKENTATEVFGIHESCSFFGKFTTKDPMHVILDNADIEADLPVKAVCHGETVYFSFDMPTMKADKPIVDEAYCISVEELDGKIVPESQGRNHYKYEPIFKNGEISGVIKNLPYDWWMGGKYDETHSYRGTIEEYLKATHPSIRYDHPEDIAHKKHGDPVKVEQAMTDFRFFYPKFDGSNWSSVTPKAYNHDTGYGLLQSEINTIKDLVENGIIILYRNTYDMPLTYQEAEELQAKELSDMMEKEMNDQILNLALKLNVNDQLPLKALESTVLGKLSANGRQQLTFEELASMTYAQVKDIAAKLSIDSSLPESELRRAVETALKAKSEEDFHIFARDNFPNIGHEKRAYLVVRALNILSRETVGKLPEADQQNSTITRQALREQMISIFEAQNIDVLRKMWTDVSAKLTEKERAALLKDRDPMTMNAAGLAVLVEDGLAKITDNVINDLRGDRYVHFTLVPIMPSQENFVDEPYIFCPEPRGVKVRITSHEPTMIDGFADMTYPENMTNVPVRLGLAQIKETTGQSSKSLRIPVRGLKPAAKNGVKAVKLAENTGYFNNIFLVKTDDPAYKQQGAVAGDDGLTEAKNAQDMFTQMVGTIEKIEATYPTTAEPNPDTYIVVKFNNGMNFREGYTYRVGINYMEVDGGETPTLSCYGTMHIDMKIVPAYQKWTAAMDNTDWTNDQNWARADRSELNAGNAASDGTKPLDAYITNEANETAKSFVPMYFTNVLIDGKVQAPVLYEGLVAANRSEKKFLEGLKASASDRIIYDMEVKPSTGAWHDNNNYECELFGTYVADGITFKPASQLINAQHLIYNKAWVEYELDVKRWYTLASPLQNTFAGEWYAPTNGGRQMTPHFYGIEYKHELNHRFQPAIYQRSWDSKGNNPVYLKQGGMQEAYIKADWSYVYNDVTKEYSEGGFSVKVADDFMVNAPEGSKALIRMPKADTKYTYYDINNATGQKPDDVLNVNANRSRLWTDKLKTDATFTQTITNVSDGNNFFLIGNPFMANMDMAKFFEVNDGLEPKLWIMTDNGQDVSVKVDGDQWIGTGVAGKVAPLQGFFVKGKNNGKTTTVTFTADMQANAGETAVALKSKASVNTESAQHDLIITAESNGFTSTAIVAVRGGTRKSFEAKEDCETFIDSNTADMPTVYTVASDQAMTINCVPQIDMLPLGIICEQNGFANVTFSGTDNDIYLYDAETRQTMTVTPGQVVSMPANTSGRYFISMNNVSGINSAEIENADSRAYDITGKRVVTPQRGTIVIVNGKKRVIGNSGTY